MNAAVAGLGIACIELDALFWAPNWTVTPEEVFQARVAEAVTADAWVADGNYRATRRPRRKCSSANRSQAVSAEPFRPSTSWR